MLFVSVAAHSPYGRAAYANVNGLDPGSTAGPGTGSGYRLHQDDQDDQQMQYQQQDFGMNSAGHSPTRRLAPPPPSRSGVVEGTYQPRPPPPVPAEAMASLNIGLDKSGRLNFVYFCLRFLDLFCFYRIVKFRFPNTISKETNNGMNPVYALVGCHKLTISMNKEECSERFYECTCHCHIK